MMNENKFVIPIEEVNSLAVFTEGGLDSLLQKIESQVTSFVPDLSTVKGRKEIGSLARKVSSSKVAIDAAGKELVSEWKSKALLVDISRKKARDFLDELRDRVRQPLTDWETEEKRVAQEKWEEETRLREEKEQARLDEIAKREEEIAAREAALAAKEEQRKQVERARQEAEEAAKREAQMKADAEAQAKREAEEAIKVEREKAEQAKRDLEAAEAQAEKQRLADAERAEREKTEAVAKERQQAINDAAARERALRQAADTKRREDEARAADREHRRTINGRIVAALTAEGISEKSAKSVVTLVASGAIPAMSIRY